MTSSILKKIFLAAILIIVVWITSKYFLDRMGNKESTSQSNGGPGTVEISPTTLAQPKNYLDPRSSDFDPSQAGNPNPKETESQVPSCCSHPYYHSTWRAFSDDGLSWQKEESKFLDHASVPDVLVKDDGTEILYYVDGTIDTMDCQVVKDEQATAGNCRIYNFSQKKAWDPEVIKIDDNLYRLYFVAPQIPEGGDKPQQSMNITSKVITAISRDGISWLEEGIALEGNEMLIDPTVIKTDSGWQMIIVSDQKGLLSATSTDGKSFTLGGAIIGPSDGKSPHLTKIGDAYSLYFCAQGIEVSSSTDALNWTNRKTVLAGETGAITCDPSVEKLPNGKYIMYYKKQITK